MFCTSPPTNPRPKPGETWPHRSPGMLERPQRPLMVYPPGGTTDRGHNPTQAVCFELVAWRHSAGACYLPCLSGKPGHPLLFTLPIQAEKGHRSGRAQPAISNGQ